MDINIVLPDLRGLGRQIVGVANVFNNNAWQEKQSNEAFSDYASQYEKTLKHNTGSLKQFVTA